MQIGVSSYSFSGMTRNGRMKEIECIAKAKEMGFDCIEFSTLQQIPEGMDIMDYAKQLREEADRVGIPIMNFTQGADLLSGSEGDLNAEIKKVEKLIDVAEILGAPGFRHDATRGKFPEGWQGAKTFDAALPRLAGACREITQYAKAKGIRTMVENHGYFAQDAIRVEKLVSAVDDSNFGVLLDIGNFACADDVVEKSVGMLAPLAFHCHAKDFHIKSGMEPWPGRGWGMTRSGNWIRGAIIGHGSLPIAQQVRAIVKSGYDGVFSVEFEGIEDTLLGIELGGKNLRRFVQMAQTYDKD